MVSSALWRAGTDRALRELVFRKYRGYRTGGPVPVRYRCRYHRYESLRL